MDDDTPLSQYLNPQLRSKWAISSHGFSGPSWNILRRALMKFDFGGIEYPTEYIETEIFEQLTLGDLLQMKHVGLKRIEGLLSELTNSTIEYLVKEKNDEKNISGVSNRPEESDKSKNLEVTILEDILVSDDWRREFHRKFDLHFENSIFEDESISRRIAIFESRVNGETLEEIGKRYGITRERVRQIVEQAFSRISHYSMFGGKSISVILTERKNSDLANKANEAAAYAKDMDLKFRQIINGRPGIKYLEIADAAGVDETLVKLYLSYQASKFVFQEPTAHNFEQHFSDEFTLDAIRMAAAIRSPLSAPMYEDLIERRLVKGPRAQSIAKRFGTWSNACRIAGVLFIHSVRNDYSRNWSQEEALQHLVSFLKNTDCSIGVLSYDEWRESIRREAPSSAHLRNMFGTWIIAKNRALEYMNHHSISCDLV